MVIRLISAMIYYIFIANILIFLNFLPNLSIIDADTHYNCFCIYMSELIVMISAICYWQTS